MHYPSGFYGNGYTFCVEGGEPLRDLVGINKFFTLQHFG